MNQDITSCLPSVSVIVPCFNAESSLPVLLRSLEGQSFDSTRFEVICVDNGSSDQTKQVIDAFARSLSIDLKRVSESERVGSYSARNKGIGVAKGDMLFFTDADCCADREWLKNGVTSLLQTGARGICGGLVELTVQVEEAPTSVEMFEMILGFSQQRNIEEIGYSVTANLMCWRSSIQDVGLFNGDLLSKGDFEWCSRARKAGYKLVYVKKARVKHPARQSLKAIITKTRRVTGGQRDIRQYKIAKNEGARSSRTLLEQLRLVLSDRRFPFIRQKLTVIMVAAVVYIVKLTEKLRLYTGGVRERR
jgi:glycosyltransferase involved in cell wall biosynthesis